MSGRTADDEAAAGLRRRLAATLRANGDLLSAGWETAVRAAPRHAFLPRFFGRQRADGTWPVVTPEAVGTSRWLELVYTDDTWVTQLDGRIDDGDASAPATATPTSSSTRPGLLVRMFERLDVGDGDTLLIVGTGTGYSTALACERLGDRHVVSQDVDPSVAARARTRLAAAGHRPTVVCADGRDGWPDTAPYDRVIAFCAFQRPPVAWVRQCRPGAVVVLTVTGGLSGFGLVRLVVDDDGGAHGRILPDDASFMTARAEVMPSPAALKPAKAPVSHSRDTSLAPEVLGDPDFAFAAQLALPEVFTFRVIDDEGHATTYLQTRDGVSWARIEPDHVVAQGGPRQLWDELEAHHDRWTTDGAPSRDKYRVTMNRTGELAWTIA